MREMIAFFLQKFIYFAIFLVLIAVVGSFWYGSDLSGGQIAFALAGLAIFVLFITIGVWLFDLAFSFIKKVPSAQSDPSYNKFLDWLIYPGYIAILYLLTNSQSPCFT